MNDHVLPVRANLNVPKAYLAAPFFNPAQIETVEELERILAELEFEVFSPRHGEHAVIMNEMLSRTETPSEELRWKVFSANCVNVDDSDLVVAVIDDRDTGAIWEMGYGYRAHVPIVTFTRHTFGMNLMLAHSIIGHTKGYDELRDALRILRPAIHKKDVEEYGFVIAEFQSLYKSEISLLEGPSERTQTRTEMETDPDLDSSCGE